MTTAPYSGNAVRSAHYSVRPSVPGVNRDHFTPDPEPDPFSPRPDTPTNQAGTILTGDPSFAVQSGQPTLATQPTRHWFDGQPSVPSGVPYGRAQQAMQERLMEDHSQSNYVPDPNRTYKHATQGQSNQFIIGRMPQNAGVDPGENLRYLVNGNNSYDATNEPNEVYTGDAPNVGRYRLGVKTNVFGVYERPIGKFGQDAQLVAYSGLHPALPTPKATIKDAAPYTPNSSGTTHWWPTSPSQIPSMFGLPSETSLTDFIAAGDSAGTSDFVDDDGYF